MSEVGAVLRPFVVRTGRCGSTVSAPPSWLETVATLTGPRHPGQRRVGTAAAELDPDAFAALRPACEPGARALEVS